MRTSAVMNQKGGCGKTTIAINLTGALTQLDRSVLLVDLDPQAHASIGLGIDAEELQITTYQLLLDPTVTLTDEIFSLNNKRHAPRTSRTSPRPGRAGARGQSRARRTAETETLTITPRRV